MISLLIGTRFMNGNSTFDSNILIYAFGPQNEVKKEIAKDILTKCHKINLQTINETLYVLQRKFNYSTTELNGIIQFLKQNFQVQNMNVSIVESAVQIMNDSKYTFWDCMMLAATLEANCDIIYSEDMQHNYIVNGKLTIINPFLR